MQRRKWITPIKMDNLDPELMRRLQSGEDSALTVLMNRWQLPLVAFITRYVGNPADAVDLAQETFVRVYESRHRYKPSAKFSTWLFTIASHLCHNFSRWQKRHPTVTLDETTDDSIPLIETLAATADQPSTSLERKELAALVRNSIQALPHDLRTTLLLFEYEDLAYEEIAAVLGCSVKAVETRLYRARAILRDKLKGTSEI